MKLSYYIIGGLLAVEFAIESCLIHGIDQNMVRTTGHHAENVPKLWQASEDNYKPEPPPKELRAYAPK